ncbi:amino acid permease [Desulfuromonas carbonis]|uniref:APC family permease n=1 Tax=Desulfuromonas sp. DDH964 TaxID=1823759 RepID=UPI00078DC9FB|nr:APC family permease [Desulfuromonas sp. DDH964]AMV70495.1 Inner membrane transport protein YbaT [Desulfuromonas sp. DDH964]
MSGKQAEIGFFEATAIGIGGMVGGGIFAVLGLAVQLARGGAPLAFALAGIVALVTAYSFSRLAVCFPSQGGTVTFLDRAFGPGLFTGTLNILLWLSYIVMLSLYAYAFGSYGATFFPTADQLFWKHLLISAAIFAITGLNLLSADLIGKAEDGVVAVKLVILLLFVGLGLRTIDPSRLAVAAWSPALDLVTGGMIIFLAYEGFELIANAAGDTRNPDRVLPRAFFSATGFVLVLYVLIAAVAVGNLPVDRIVEAKDYALAVAAKPFLGQSGFLLITVAALLSTASAINATLYGAARLSYVIAKDGELPELLAKKVWNEPLEGLLITAGGTLLIANLFDLSSLSTMGSAGFLLIFAAVNGANARLASRTGSHRWLSLTGAGLCLAALVALLWQTLSDRPARVLVLIGMLGLAFAIEAGFRLATGRPLRVATDLREEKADPNDPS